jgi:3-isopropylmalate/(R)-2-methylmalate dehydratase small subunit
MQAFTTLNANVALLARENVDTDAIIPKQFLKLLGKTGFGLYAFDAWRYLEPGEPGDTRERPLNPAFELNAAKYLGAEILLTQENFGCGSSREHAVWALMDYGFKVVIAPSFADIFYTNALNNGLLALTLDPAVVAELTRQRLAAPGGYHLTIDLAAQTVVSPAGDSYGFAIDPFRKQRLIQGLDDIAWTLQQADAIRAYEQRRRVQAPWL